jgi:hypothetical protein
MACMMRIFSESKIEKNELFDYVKSVGGEIGEIKEFQQGVISFNDSTIWIYYRDVIKCEFDEVSKFVLNNHLLNIYTEVAIEIGNGDYSE